MTQNLSAQANSGTMAYIVSGINHVCAAFKKRSPGSQTERAAQDYLAKELGQWADSVSVEEFTLHPAAFMGFIPVSALLGIAASIVFFINRTGASPLFAWLPLVLLVPAALMFVFEFLLYRRFIDVFFPKSVSKNVYAVRRPWGEVKRRIIFGGHADGAWEWTYSLHGQIKTLAPVMGGSILGLFVSLIFSVAYLAAGSPEVKGFWFAAAVAMLAFIPFYIAVAFFINWRVVADGANDNLSACYAAMAVLKEMSESDFRYENTEVACLITGSEEAGLRGAKAFAKKHAAELKKAQTVFIPLETLRELDQLAVYNRDETGMVHNSEAVAELLIAAGKKAGVTLKRAPVFPGSTDAAAFTQQGLMAAGLGGVNHNPQKYYHTRCDSPDNISPECIQKGIEIAVEAATLFDREGLGKA